MAITLRSSKGSALTHTELDNNFTTLYTPSANTVGSYILAAEYGNNRSKVSIGGTKSGAYLKPTSISFDNPQNYYTSYVRDDYVVQPGYLENSTLSGTWRCMGAYAQSSYNDSPVTLWLRIS
jgi:hypothetical protein